MMITLQQINTDAVTVPVMPLPFSQPHKCFSTVQIAVDLYGGKMRVGWCILDLDVAWQAQHHAIWEMPDGDLADLTTLRQATALFIEDANAERIVVEVDGQQKRVPLPSQYIAKTHKAEAVAVYLHRSEIAGYLNHDYRKSDHWTAKACKAATRLGLRRGSFKQYRLSDNWGQIAPQLRDHASDYYSLAV